MHHVEFHRSALPLGQYLAQLEYLILGSLAGKWIAFEVYAFYGYAAFHGHPAGHRRIDAAGQQQQGFAAAGHRKTAGAAYGLAVNVCAVLSDLQIDGDLRVAHFRIPALISGQTAEQLPCHSAADLRRSQWIGLIRASRFHLEGTALGQRIHQHLPGGGGKIVHIFFHPDDRRQGIDAEDFGQSIDSLVILGFFDLYPETSPTGAHLPAVQTAQRGADIGSQLCNEQVFIFSFKPQLAVADEQKLFIIIHNQFISVSCCGSWT